MGGARGGHRLPTRHRTAQLRESSGITAPPMRKEPARRTTKPRADTRLFGAFTTRCPRPGPGRRPGGHGQSWRGAPTHGRASDIHAHRGPPGSRVRENTQPNHLSEDSPTPSPGHAAAGGGRGPSALGTGWMCPAGSSLLPLFPREIRTPPASTFLICSEKGTALTTLRADRGWSAGPAHSPSATALLHRIHPASSLPPPVPEFSLFSTLAHPPPTTSLQVEPPSTTTQRSPHPNLVARGSS